MSVEVRPEPRQALRRSTRLGAGLAGDGLLVRLRSTTIAMLGVVAAVGLALVGVASQMGWPSVLSGPLPQAPAAFARNATIVAPASPSAHQGSTHRQRRGGGATAPASGAPAPESELTAANPVESPVPSSPSAPNQPRSPESQDHDTPSNPAPATSPEAAPAPASDDGPAPTSTTPPAKGGPPPPVAAAPESAPGHSEESHGNHYGGGPPPWAGAGSSGSSPGVGSGGHDYDGDDDGGGGWGHH